MQARLGAGAKPRGLRPFRRTAQASADPEKPPADAQRTRSESHPAATRRRSQPRESSDQRLDAAAGPLFSRTIIWLPPSLSIAGGLLVAWLVSWLLTGSLVFKGSTPMETIVLQVNREPEPPSRRTTRTIPAHLEEIALACLSKDPADRPQTADELATRLGSVRMAEEWTPLRAREWWNQNQPASPAGAAEPVMAEAGAVESG